MPTIIPSPEEEADLRAYMRARRDSNRAWRRCVADYHTSSRDDNLEAYHALQRQQNEAFQQLRQRLIDHRPDEWTLQRVFKEMGYQELSRVIDNEPNEVRP